MKVVLMVVAALTLIVASLYIWPLWLAVVATSTTNDPDADTLSSVLAITVALWIGSLGYIVWFVRQQPTRPRASGAEHAEGDTGPDVVSLAPTVARGSTSMRPAEVAPPPGAEPQVASTRSPSFYVAPVLLGLWALGVVWVIVNFSAAAERSGSATPIPRWTIPEGFSMSADPEIAYRWDEGGSCLKDACWDMTVTTLYGCPHSLYVELTTLDADDTPIGYTNDKVGSIRGGEQAHLQFETSNEAADKVRIAIVTCD